MSEASRPRVIYRSRSRDPWSGDWRALGPMRYCDRCWHPQWHHAGKYPDKAECLVFDCTCEQYVVPVSRWRRTVT
jgi:hypothetical protein